MPTEIHTDSFYAMGTRCDVIIAQVDKWTFEGLMSRLIAEVDRVEKLLSIYLRESEFSMINHHAHTMDYPPVQEVLDLITYCVEMYDKTFGYFDITLSASDSTLVMEFDQKMTINPRKGTVRFLQEGVRLDSGAFGKGYAIDRMEEILENEKIESALINFGNSSILALGRNPKGEDWSIGIVHPEKQEQLLYTHQGSNLYISTSGNTRANEGHLIPPGLSEQHRASVANSLMTVSARSGLEAEVLSTALYWANEEESSGIEKSFNCKANRLWIEDYL